MVLNLWVATHLVDERPFHWGYLRPSENTVYITIHNMAKLQL